MLESWDENMNLPQGLERRDYVLCQRVQVTVSITGEGSQPNLELTTQCLDDRTRTGFARATRMRQWDATANAIGRFERRLSVGEEGSASRDLVQFTGDVDDTGVFSRVWGVELRLKFYKRDGDSARTLEGYFRRLQ